MLYDNTVCLLLSKYCKIRPKIYFKEKLEQTVEFLLNNFKNKEGFLGPLTTQTVTKKKENIMYFL